MGETPNIKQLIKKLDEVGITLPPKIRNADGLKRYLKAILKNLGYKESRLENELNQVKEQIKTINETLNKLGGD